MRHILIELADRLLDDDSKKFIENGANIYSMELKAAWMRGFVEGLLHPEKGKEDKVIQMMQALRKEADDPKPHSN